VPLVDDPDVAVAPQEGDRHLVVVVAVGVLDDVGARFGESQGDVTLAVGGHAQAAHRVAADGADQRHGDRVPGETQ
jgi:hypothetical protein